MKGDGNSTTTNIRVDVVNDVTTIYATTNLELLLLISYICDYYANFPTSFNAILEQL